MAAHLNNFDQLDYCNDNLPFFLSKMWKTVLEFNIKLLITAEQLELPKSWKSYIVQFFQEIRNILKLKKSERATFRKVQITTFSDFFWLKKPISGKTGDYRILL